MTSETKVGLLIGLGVILLIGIIVSDHLSDAQRQEPARMENFADLVQGSITPPGQSDPGDAARADTTPPAAPLIEDRADAIQLRRPSPLLDRDQAQPVVDPDAGDQPSGPPIVMETVRPPRLEPEPIADGAASITLDRRSAPRSPLDRLRRDGSDAADRESADPPAPSGTETIHYVARGESGAAIAGKYYDDAKLWPTIAERNAQLVRSDGQVDAGTRLVIPSLTAARAAAKRSPTRTERAQTATRTGDTITVKPGDTLSQLAERHLGSSKKWRQLFEANRSTLKRPEALRAGMKLKLPASAGAGAGAEPPRKTPSTRKQETSRDSGKTYTVRAGDNLTRIAEKKLGDGDRWRELFEANRDKLTSADDLKVGQKLVLPK